MSDLRARIFGTALMLTFVAAIGSDAAFAQGESSVHNTGVDPSVAPGSDFYGYANGLWLKSTPLPDGVAKLDTTSLLRAENARRVQDLIEDAAATPSASVVAQKVGDYYASQLDAAGIEAKGFAPLAEELAAISAIANRKALTAYLGHTLRLDDGTNQQTESLWGVWIHQGFHDADHYAAHLVQGGLGLAQTDYLDPAPEIAARRALYRAHIANVLRAAGLDDPESRAGRVLDLEIAIAGTHAPLGHNDDVFRTDNTWRRADFIAKAPGLDWGVFFSAAGLDSAPSFVVWQPQAVIGGSKLLAIEPIEAWKDYLTFHLIEHYAGVLPKAIGDERLAFEARFSGASPAPAPDRKTQAIAATQAALGDAVGQLYVARYFTPQSKSAATAMVENIRVAFGSRLRNLTWMSGETKAEALAKLAALKVGLGYPDSWIDTADLEIVRGDAFGNLKRAESFAYRRAVAKMSRPVDPNELAEQLHPQMVGAILNLSPNSMQFTAGLLQPPYFDGAGDAASNYGSAGAGISHEISHSFDEVGNLYDAQGRLASWWTAEDLALYRAAAAPLAAQLDSCCPVQGLCAKSARILSESAADLVGLAVAYDAYLLSLKGKPDVVKNGLTGEQRFFVAFAQRWRRQQTGASLRQQIETDNHAPPQCRSNLVQNSEAWARAFGVKRGDALYLEPEARSRIW